jgi:glycosyltransferase involved in cell wall biosynthesis
MFFSSALENIAGYWRSFYLGKYLAMRGHNLYIFAQGKLPKFQKRNINNIYLYLFPPFYEGNISCNTTPRIISQTIMNTLCSIISQIDVMHVFDHLMPPNFFPILVLKILRGRSKKPLIFVDWDDWWGRGGILNIFHENIGWPIIRFLTFVEEKIPFYSDGITVTTGTLKSRALSLGINPKNIFILPNGTNIGMHHYVETQKARKLVNLPENKIIYTYGKSLFDSIKLYNDPLWKLLCAHKIVVKTFPEVFLNLLGQGSEKIVNIAKKCNVGKNIISSGYQQPEKYHLYLAASDFFVIVLRGDLFDFSRLPLRLLDYMAIGKPIIATDLPEIRKIIKRYDYGLLYRPNDPEDLAEKIMKMIENLNSWKAKTEKIRENIIRLYSWRHLAENLEKIYAKFL